MRYGLNLPNGGACSDAGTLAEFAALAEYSGWDGVFLEDYIVYQGRRDIPTHDPWVALAAMALRTQRIRLGTEGRPWHELHKIPMMIRAAQPQVEEMFSRMTGRPETMEGLDDAWGDTGESQMSRLRHYWRAKLGGELLRFAHQPLGNYGDVGEER